MSVQLTRTIRQSVFVEPISLFKCSPFITHPSCILCIRISFFLDKTKVYVDLGRRCKLLDLAHQELIIGFVSERKVKDMNDTYLEGVERGPLGNSIPGLKSRCYVRNQTRDQLVGV